MRSRALLVLVVLLFGACGGSDVPADPPAPDATDDSEGRPIVTGDDGVPVDCPFRVSDRCYDASEAACRAAGCAPDGCAILESYPAQVRCE